MKWVHAVCLLGLSLAFTGCERRAPRVLEAAPAPSPEAAASSSGALPPKPPSEQFLSLMHAGKNHFDQGDATNALAVYTRALALAPNDADLRLNLANAHLLAGAANDALREAHEVLKLEPNSAPAWFVKGSAHLRLSDAAEAVKALENANRIEPGVTATLFQLGLAHTGMKQWEAAIAALREGLGLDPNRLHSGAHYLIGQALIRLGRSEEGRRELELHQANVDAGGIPLGGANFERSKYTQARVPFKLDQPDAEPLAMRYVEASREVFGADADRFRGPAGVVDATRPGWPGLFLMRTDGKENAFVRLVNSNGVFVASPIRFPVPQGATYSRMRVGDLQNDRFDDVVVLGESGSRLFRFATNGVVTEVTTNGVLAGLRAVDGALMDLDFTGKLDLLAVASDTHEVRVLRQFGALQFSDITRTSGVPATLRDARGIQLEDWNRDGNPDVVISRGEGPPMLLEKQRGGPLVPRDPASWSAGSRVCVADFDNDLRPDLAVAVEREGKAVVHFQAGHRVEIPGLGTDAGRSIRRLVAHDFDADGWLDLWVVGPGIRVWRNLGLSGFQERTRELGLDALPGGDWAEVHFADFDQDCDSDVVAVPVAGPVRYLRNEGGHAHGLVKVHMVGNRSNASGLGCRIEIETGGLRLIRTVHQMPVEVGVGRHAQLDSFLVHWFNWPQGSAELPFDCREPLLALELTIQEGSCPYLYAWDGERFRFVTDILGSAPLGLPVAPGRYVESDPEEYVWLGNARTFPPRAGSYEVRITEELREVLYLDEARLVVVDHPPGTEVHSTDKLRSGRPYPEGGLVTLREERPLRHAATLEGRDVTEALRAVDGRRVSPPRLRTPQLRGLAEPHGVMLDFGPLDAARPLVLVMNGWLRFGGGMANIAAAHDPNLPFPFPRLEAETGPGIWKPVDADVGAPSGKTKTIVVDLAGRLEPGTRRLRWTSAFEIHWDRIALLERAPEDATRLRTLAPGGAELRFRGFGPLRSVRPDEPLTPEYDDAIPNSVWTILPGGWCTRYGDVRELVTARDEGLVLVNSGDELSLRFPADALPPSAPGVLRDFFLHVDGWDKDSDFHVATGDQVEPLPFHGMDDQQYGREARPPFPSDDLHVRYNTRWVDGRALKQLGAARASKPPLPPEIADWK